MAFIGATAGLASLLKLLNDFLAPREFGTVSLGAARITGETLSGRVAAHRVERYLRHRPSFLRRRDDELWNRRLRDMIVRGAATPSRIVSHRLSLDAAPVAFAKFDAREEGYIKVILELA
jgi:threonine dehydrogenase-like Zn-dependent dehydrogenase